LGRGKDPGSGSRILGVKRHRIPDLDPQHWYPVLVPYELASQFYSFIFPHVYVGKAEYWIKIRSDLGLFSRIRIKIFTSLILNFSSTNLALNRYGTGTKSDKPLIPVPGALNWFAFWLEQFLIYRYFISSVADPEQLHFGLVGFRTRLGVKMQCGSGFNGSDPILYLANTSTDFKNNWSVWQFNSSVSYPHSLPCGSGSRSNIFNGCGSGFKSRLKVSKFFQKWNTI
jgi:hypothetical protein